MKYQVFIVGVKNRLTLGIHTQVFQDFPQKIFNTQLRDANIDGDLRGLSQMTSFTYHGVRKYYFTLELLYLRNYLGP